MKYRVWDVENESYNDPYSSSYYAMTQDGGVGFYCHGDHTHSCDPEKYIVELSTGLKDKNDKEIYEGDIVEWINGLGEKHIFEIMWNECRASFQMVEIGQEYPYILQGLSDKMKPYCEVICNIHEPPKDFRPEHLKRMGVTMVKGDEE